MNDSINDNAGVPNEDLIQSLLEKVLVLRKSNV